MNVSHIIYVPVADITGSNTAELTTYLGKPGNILYDNDFQKADCYFVGWAEQAIVPDGTLVHQLYTNASKIRLEGGKLQLQLNELPQNPVVHYNPWQNVAADLTNDNGIATLNLYAQYKPLIVMTAEKLWYPLGAKAEYELWIEDPLHNQKPNPDAVAHFGNSQVAMVLMRTTEGKTLDATKYEIIPGFYRTTEDGVNWQWAPQEGHDANGRKYSYLMTEFISPEQEGFHTEEEIIDHFNNKRTWSSMYITMLNKGDNLSKYTAITLKDQTNETHSYLAVTNSNQPDAVQTVKETENYHFTLRNFKVDLALPLIHRIQTNHTEIRIDSPKDGAKYLCLKLPEYTENPIWFSKGDTTWTSNDGNFTISEVNDELIITPLTYDFSDKAGKKVYALFTVNNTDVPLDSNCAFSDVKSYDNLPEITDLKQEPHIKNENGVITHNVVTAKIPAGTYAGAKYTLGYMNGGTFQAVFGNESPDLDEKITFIVPAGTLNGVTTYYIQGIDPALTFKDTVFNETVQMDLTGPVITAQDSFGVTTGDLIGAGDGAVTTDDAKDIITFKYTKGESTVSLPDGIEFDYVAGKFSGKTADVLDVSQTGTYTITVTAEDVFGNVSTKNIAFTVTQKPTTDAITSITQNANNADGDVSLTIQGTKNGILRFYSEESPTVFTEIEIPSLIGSDITNADGTKDIIVPKEEIIRFKDKKIFITQQKANELESNKTDSSVETVDKKNKKKISTGGAVVIDNVAPMPLCVDQPLANTDTLRISNTSVEAVLPDIKDVDKINIKIGAFIECEPKREYDNVTGEPTNIWTCGAGYTFTETEELVWVELDPNDPDNRVQKTVGVLTYKFAEPTKFEEFQVIEAVYYDYLGNASLPVTTSVPKLPDPVAPSDMTAINNSQEHPLTTIIKGKADPGAEISVKIGETTWSVIVDEHGDFTLEIAKQNKGTAITVKSTLNYYSASADVTVQNVMADDYPLTITDINKKYGVSTTEEEIKAAVTIPTYPAGQEPPVVTIDAGQTLPDGNTSGDYTINITVTYQDGSTNKGSVKVSVYYQYTVNYCIRLASGENTVKPVPGLEAKIDSLPLGDGDVGPLPDGGKYALATGQNTVKTIQAQENVFTFYYIDDAPVFVGCGDVSIEHNAVFDPLAGVTVTDDEDISINIFTVQPESIDTSKPGKYTLTYRVTDSGGNETVKQRIVTVKPQPPYDLTAINDSKAHSAKTAVRGKADPGATVSVTISSSQWSMNVGESGEFTLMITKQPTGNVIEVKSTMNGYTKSANVTVQNVMADDYEPTVTAVIKDFGAAASEDEVKAAVTVPGFPQELQQPTVSVDAGQTLPDGNTSGDYTIDVTVTYPDSTTDAATVTIRVKYQYSVKYRRQLEDGTKTDIAVPGINDITGSLLLGPHSFGELQTVGKFAPVAGQDTDVTIQTDNNNFIYYYKDDAPVFSGCDNVVIEYGSDFDPRAGVTATDDEDGDLTASFTVTPDSINTSNPVVYNLEYKVIDSGGNVVTKQRTVTIKPQAPYNMTAINDRQAHQDKTRITGKADKGANISVTIEGTTWSVIADANGDFTLNIDKQNKGEIITVTSKLNNQTTSANVTVQNVLADDYLPTVADIDREYGVATNEAEIKAAVTIPNYPVGEAQPIVTVDEGQTIPDGNTSGDHPINVTVTYSDGSTNKVVVTVSVYYQYTVKYRRQLEDGTNTDIAVPGINDITGSLPLGEHDFDQLQVIGKFAPVAGQNTKKEIKTEGNVFTFYYVDDAPVFSGCDNVVIEYGSDFDPRAGVTATDDEDGDLTASFTVTPDSINTSNPVVYNLEYKVIDSGGNVVTKQRTVTIKPQAPYNMTAINDRQAHETTTVITGKADKGAEISVTIGAKTWGTVVDNNGNFTLNIDKQNKGEIITVTSKLNNQTTSANVTVQNVLADDYLPTVADIDREYGVATNEAEIKAAVTIPNYPVGEAQPIVTIDQGQTIPDGNTSGDHPINVTVTYSDGSTNKVVVTVSVYYQYTINNRIRLENGNNTAKPVPDKPQEVGSLPLGAHNFQLQAIGQYAPAANQITDVTIQTEGNVFTFYYIDEAPVFTEFEDIYVGYNDAFNPKTGIKAIDDEEGEIEYTVTPAAIDTSVPDEYILTYRAEDSSGNVTVKTRKITVLPQPVYDYTIYFLIQLENGNKTDKAVPNKLPKTGQLPEGPYSFGQLQPIGKYAPVPNQVTDVTIQTEGNVFTFYYIDEAPVFTGCEDIIIEYGTPFNPRAGVAVTDDEEGEVEYTVTPEVNVNQPSDYVLTYRAEDSSGNVTVKARTVTVLPRAPYDLTAINNRQLHPTTTVITGKANPGAVISVEIAPKTWAVQVGAQGNFTLSIDKQLKDTVIEVKATLNNHIKSANVIVQNVQADDYLPTVADIVKQYGVPATQAEVTNAVTVPNYPAGQQQPAVTVDAGQTIPDGNTSGDYPINVTVTYPDGSANAATVKVSVLYRYKVNYRIRLEDGSNTNKQVPGINDITGSLPLGAHDFGQLQVVGQYTPAANQNTDVTIQTEGNVFTFYYIDDAPVFTGCDNVVIEHGIPFNPRAGVTVADDEDGDLTDSFTVQPANIDTTDPKIYVLEYKVTDSGGNVVTKQRTVTIKPQAPYNMTAINDSKAHETTTVITGKADKGAEISVTIGNDTWNTVVDNNGNFTLNIDKQNKGVVLEVKATLNNHTKSANVIVQNVQADDYEPTVIDIFKKFGVATTEAEVKAAVAVENYPAGQLQPAVTVNLAELPDGLTSGDNQVSVTVTYPDGTKDDVKVTVKVNYRYKVNYFIRLANGDNTTKPVPNILPKTGDLPVGQHELGPLPDGGAYAKVENQGTLVTIDGTTDNVFNFYYVDDAPVFNDFDDVILMYGALINPKMDVTAIDDEDGEIDFTVAPKIDTTVPGIYTVTYRAEDSGGNVTEKTRKVTVNQAQNVTYEPVVVPEIVEYNGVVNLKDNVTNLQQLPEGTMILDTTHPAIDTTVPGKHTGQITVIYRDGTSDVFNVDVTVQPQPMNQIYEPDVFPEIVEYGEVINLLDNIANADTFPDNTDISDTTDPVIDTTVPGVYKGQITVTYPDGTKDVVNVKVTVNPQPDIPDNQVYNPNVVDEVVEYDGVIDLTDNVLNFENLPDGTQVADTTAQPIDTKVPGTYPGQLTITYPDQTTDVYNIQVTVKTQPHNEKYVPVVIPEIVEYGDVINLKDNVTNADTFPLNTVISDTTDPVIDSTVPGLYRGEITVTYPDGTKNVVNVQVTVKHKPDIPDNQSYNPVVVDETVPYGGVIDLTDNVTNLDNLPDQTTVTDTTAQPIDTRLPGTYAGEITITYPDQTTTVINVQVTVQPQPLNEKFEPVVVPEIVEYSGVINLKDNVTNADELPLNTVIADTTVPPINTRLPGVYTGQITVTYPDQTTDVVDVQVRVQPEPDYLADEEVNAPVVIDEIVAYGGVIDLTDNVLNLKDLPAGTRVMEIYKQEIDTTVPGTYRGQLAVIYPDASVIVSDVRIIVKEQTQSDTHNPVVRDDETVGYGEDIDWKDVIDNIDDLPPGTTVTETSENPIDTTVPGTHQGQVTVTYPDGSQEVIDVTVTVEEQPQSDIHNPVVRDDETVGYGEDIDWKDVIDNIDDLPPGTTVTETSENPIDTTVPGTHQGQVTVTYPDGSQEVIDVTVTVEEQPQSDTHNPVVRDDEIVGYGEEIDWRDVIDNIDDLPPGTTVTETSENPIDTTVPGTHQGQVTITYPDGSQEVIDVTVTVEEQPQSDRYNPVIGSETVEYGKEIEWKDVVENMEDLPEGTTVTDTSAQPLDTTVPGTYIREITITYPDGSTEVMEVEVTVKEDSGQAPSPTPGPDTEEETPEEVKEESWSLVSVISTVFSALAMLIQFLIKSVKVDDSGAHFVRNKIFKLITAVLAVVAIVYLFSTNNLSLTMRMVNETTPVSAIMTVATTTSLILGMRWKPSKK